MACAMAAPVFEPSGNFSAWLEAQGVNMEMAQAIKSELGIQDYGVLRACVGDDLVRGELLATARDRLPFGFYAVLRQLVKVLQGVECYDGGAAPCLDAVAVAAAASSPGDVMLSGLVDVLRTLFSDLSKELLLSVRRLDDMTNTYAADSATSTGDISPDNTKEEVHPQGADKSLMMVINGSEPNVTKNLIKSEPLEDTTADRSYVLPSQNSEQGADEHTSGDALLYFHPNIIDKVIYLPNSVTNLACATEDEPYPLMLDETQQEKPAATPVINTKSQKLENKHRKSVTTIQKQPLPVSETELIGANPVGNPQMESSGVTLPQCKMCKTNFLSKNELEAHVRRHTSKPVHRCEVCGRVFLQATGLKIHLRTHKGVAPYTCGECGYGCLRFSDLKIHWCKHKGEKRYQCEVCGRGFDRIFEQRVHMRKHISEKPQLECTLDGPHHYIGNLYGEEILDLSKNLGKLRSKKMTMLSNLAFLQRCRDSNIVPRFYKLQHTLQLRRTERILHRASMDLLRACIANTRRQLDDTEGTDDPGGNRQRTGGEHTRGTERCPRQERSGLRLQERRRTTGALLPASGCPFAALRGLVAVCSFPASQ